MLTNQVLQWLGAVFIIMGHSLNAAAWDGYNIVAFGIGTVFFLAWSVRVHNQPQMLVNIVATMACIVGMIRAFA